MSISVLPDKNTFYLDEVLMNEDKTLRVLPSKALSKIPNLDLRLWCHINGVYGVPSLELMDILESHIKDADKTIEVGGGNGVFGRYLGLVSTDSFIQNKPEIKAYYALVAQPIVNYGKDVLQYEASEAILHHKPSHVLGSWVTQYVAPDDPNAIGGMGSEYGLKELEFVPLLQKYIVYGNEYVHGKKYILSDPRFKVTKIFDEKNFFSRASVPEANCLYIVENR